MEPVIDLTKRHLGKGNNYFLRRYIAGGGMGDVYNAWDRDRNLEVAVKVIRMENLLTDAAKAHELQGSELANQVVAHYMQRFGEEAQILAALEHDNIVRFWGGEVDPTLQIPFFVMGWIEGSDGEHLIEQSGSVPLLRVVDIMYHVCTALNYAHNKGLVHCDIKPANMLISNQQNIYLSDFGLARASRKAGGGGGTLLYMAPEQFADNATLDGRTDIYALGVSLFHFLTGEFPFIGQHPSSRGHGSTPGERLAWEHKFLETPSIRQYKPSLPEGIDRVIGQATSKQPTGRFASTIDLYNALSKSVYESTKSHQGSEPATPCLVGVQGQYAGQQISIPEGTMMIGRRADYHTSGLYFDDKTVSHDQARVQRQGNTVSLENLSKYDTFVNRQPVNTKKLRHGDRIELGDHEILEYRDH